MRQKTLLLGLLTVLIALVFNASPTAPVSAQPATATIEIVDPQGEFLLPGTVIVTDLGGPIDGATPESDTVYTTVLSGADFLEAVAEIDQAAGPVVRLRLTADAEERFFAYTSAHIGLPLAIVYNKRVLSTPVINQAIRGQIIIAGLTDEENGQLAQQISSGMAGVSATPAALATPEGVASPEAVATPDVEALLLAAPGCWSAAQIVSTAPLQFSAAPALTIDPTKTYTASVETNLGDFTITFLPGEAPQTVNNFVCLARVGYYDQTPIHRILADFVIQAGDPTGTGTGDPGYEFADEPVTSAYELGTVAMANAGPNTNGSQFFIVVGQAGTQLPPNYTIFGNVTEGLEVVQQIAAVQTRADARGEPSVPVDPIIIERITITES